MKRILRFILKVVSWISMVLLFGANTLLMPMYLHSRLPREKSLSVYSRELFVFWAIYGIISLFSLVYAIKHLKTKSRFRIITTFVHIIAVFLPLATFFYADYHYTPKWIEAQRKVEEREALDSKKFEKEMAEIRKKDQHESANTPQSAAPPSQHYPQPPKDNGCRIIKTPRPPTEVRVDKTTNESRTIPGNDGSYLICADGVKQYEIEARPDVFVQGLKPIEREPMKFNYKPEYTPPPPHQSQPIITRPVNPPPKQYCFNNGYSAGCLDY